MGGSLRFRKTIFDNGLTLLTERHPEFRSLSIGVWVRAGTRHEEPREAGISHFLEHMLFKGTATRSALDIAKEVDQVGGEFNAFTAREYTCFHLLLLDRDLALGTDILSDILLNSKFDADEMERERKVILQEISMVDESPEEMAHDEFFKLLYGRHGLGRPILGSETSVRRMRRGDLLRYFRKHYRPEQLIVSVAGNVEHDSVKRRLRDLARQAPSGSSRGGISGADPAPPMRQGSWWLPRDTEQVHLVWGAEGPRYSARERFAAYLLNTYLGGGMSSVLFQEIREKHGLAYSVYSNVTPFVDSGVFSIYLATNLQQVPTCMRLLRECVGKLRKDLMSDEDLELTKENLKGTVLLNADSVESRMSSIAKNEMFLGRFIGVDEICRLIDEVTPSDIRKVARRYFRADRESLLLFGPKPSKQILGKIGPIRVLKS